MIVYHGSITAIDKPQILVPESKRTVDFGNGFYTTTDYDQACRWVKIKIESTSAEKGFVSFYEVDDDLLKKDTLKILSFPTATKEWLDFVFENRQNPSFKHDYDIVFGPVANDRVYASLSLYESHFFDVETTIKNLKTYTLVNQILFHTENSLKELRFVKSEEII